MQAITATRAQFARFADLTTVAKAPMHLGIALHPGDPPLNGQTIHWGGTTYYDSRLTPVDFAKYLADMPTSEGRGVMGVFMTRKQLQRCLALARLIGVTDCPILAALERGDPTDALRRIYVFGA